MINARHSILSLQLKLECPEMNFAIMQLQHINEELYIVTCTNNAGKELGFLKEELVGANIEKIIPEDIRVAHKISISKDNLKGELKSNMSKEKLPFLTKSGFIKNLYITLKPLQLLQSQLGFAAYLHNDGTDEEVLLLTEDLKISEFSSSAFESFNQVQYVKELNRDLHKNLFKIVKTKIATKKLKTLEKGEDFIARGTLLMYKSGTLIKLKSNQTVRKYFLKLSTILFTNEGAENPNQIFFTLNLTSVEEQNRKTEMMKGELSQSEQSILEFFLSNKGINLKEIENKDSFSFSSNIEEFGMSRELQFEDPILPIQNFKLLTNRKPKFSKGPKIIKKSIMISEESSNLRNLSSKENKNDFYLSLKLKIEKWFNKNLSNPNEEKLKNENFKQDIIDKLQTKISGLINKEKNPKWINFFIVILCLLVLLQILLSYHLRSNSALLVKEMKNSFSASILSVYFEITLQVTTLAQTAISLINNGYLSPDIAMENYKIPNLYGPLLGSLSVYLRFGIPVYTQMQNILQNFEQDWAKDVVNFWNQKKINVELWNGKEFKMESLPFIKLTEFQTLAFYDLIRRNNTDPSIVKKYNVFDPKDRKKI